MMAHSANSPMHIQLPVNYATGFGTASGPASPYELYPPFYNPHQPPASDLHSQSHLADRPSTASTIATTQGSSTDADRSPTHSSVSAYSGSNRSNSHHPGHIALPPPPLVTSFPPLGHPHSPHMMSPSHAHYLISLQQQQSHHTTPHGLPPITPSMPPFNFLPPFTPPAYNPNHPLGSPGSPSGMPHPHSHILSPFSPGATMSPGSFWGRPGGANPFLNPTVGAPVRTDVDPPGPGHDATSGSEDTGYFPPMPPIIAVPVPRAKASAEEDGVKEEELTSPSETDAEPGEHSSSSGATSWHTSDEMSGQLEEKMVLGEEALESGVVEKEIHASKVSIDESSSRAPSRTQSLSPSLKKPPLTHRPDSDP